MATNDEETVQLAICLENGNVPASLEPCKVYRVVPPLPGDGGSMIRIVDESGSDYLYPRAWFLPLELPARTAASLPLR